MDALMYGIRYKNLRNNGYDIDFMYDEVEVSLYASGEKTNYLTLCTTCVITHRVSRNEYGGQAIFAKNDKFDLQRGKNIAFGRAYKKMLVHECSEG